MTSILDPYMNSSQQESLREFTYIFIVWNVLNLIVMNLNLPDKHLKREDMLDMRNRMISIVHGTIGLFLAAYNTYFLHSQCGSENTKFEGFILTFSCAYFAYDFLVMAYFRILDSSMLIHHSICIFGMAFCVLTKSSAWYLIAAEFVSEISNPAMHVRMILKHLGLRYTKAYELAELVYMCNNLLSDYY